VSAIEAELLSYLGKLGLFAGSLFVHRVAPQIVAHYGGDIDEAIRRTEQLKIDPRLPLYSPPTEALRVQLVEELQRLKSLKTGSRKGSG